MLAGKLSSNLTSRVFTASGDIDTSFHLPIQSAPQRVHSLYKAKSHAQKRSALCVFPSQPSCRSQLRAVVPSPRQRVSIIPCLPAFSHASGTKAVTGKAGVISALRASRALQPLGTKEEATADFLLRTFSL